MKPNGDPEVSYLPKQKGVIFWKDGNSKCNITIFMIWNKILIVCLYASITLVGFFCPQAVPLCLNYDYWHFVWDIAEASVGSEFGSTLSFIFISRSHRKVIYKSLNLYRINGLTFHRMATSLCQPRSSQNLRQWFWQLSTKKAVSIVCLESTNAPQFMMVQLTIFRLHDGVTAMHIQ